jgi:hypothetical protein
MDGAMGRTMLQEAWTGVQGNDLLGQLLVETHMCHSGKTAGATGW